MTLIPTDDGRLQIDVNRSRYVFSTSSLGEKRIERVVRGS